MNLRELLSLCQDDHLDDWIEVPYNRPATAMLSGVVDPGFEDRTDIRPLAGSHLAVYEPTPAVSMIWLVPEEAEVHRGSPVDGVPPEWMEADETGGWNGARSVRSGYVVILLAGAPVWQEPMSYVTWGAAIGGYVPQIERAIHDGTERGYSATAEWVVSAWSVGLASLLGNLSGVAKEWWARDHLGLSIVGPFLRPVLGGDHWLKRTEESAIELAQEVAHQMGLSFKRGLRCHEPACISEVTCRRTTDKAQSAQDFALARGLGSEIGRHGFSL